MLPVPAPEDLYDIPAPACGLSSFTPEYIESMMHMIHGRATMRGVTKQDVDTWKSLYPEVVESDNIKCEYDSFTSRFITKCGISPVHESVSIFFTRQVTKVLETRLTDHHLDDLTQVSAGAGRIFQNPAKEPSANMCKSMAGLLERVTTRIQRSCQMPTFTSRDMSFPPSSVRLGGPTA